MDRILARNKAPIYREENVVCNPVLIRQLYDAAERLEEAMKATVPISRGTTKMGFGVSKTQKDIAADAVISIARAIKSLKGW